MFCAAVWGVILFSADGNGTEAKFTQTAGNCYVDAFTASLEIAARKAGKIPEGQMLSPMEIQVADQNAQNVMKKGPNGKPLPGEIRKGFATADKGKSNGKYVDGGDQSEVWERLSGDSNIEFGVYRESDLFWGGAGAYSSGGREVNEQLGRRMSSNFDRTTVVDRPVEHEYGGKPQSKIKISDFKFDRIDLRYPDNIPGANYVNDPFSVVPASPSLAEHVRKLSTGRVVTQSSAIEDLKKHKRERVGELLDASLSVAGGGIVVSIPSRILLQTVSGELGKESRIENVFSADGTGLHATTIVGRRVDPVSGEVFYAVRDSNLTKDEAASLGTAFKKSAEGTVFIRASDLDQVLDLARVSPKNMASGFPEKFQLAAPSGYRFPNTPDSVTQVYHEDELRRHARSRSSSSSHQ